MSLRLFRKRAAVKLAAFFVSLLAVGAAVADQNYVGVGSFSGGSIPAPISVVGSVTATGQFLAKDGTTSSPGYGFTSETNMGIYRVTTGQLGVVSGGTETVRFLSTIALNLLPTLKISWGTALGAADIGLDRPAAGVLKIDNGSSGGGWLQQAAGDLALNADYANATSGFTNTTLITPSNLASGRTYSWDAYLYFQDSTAADGAQFNFNAGAATVTNFRGHCLAKNNVGADIVLTNAATTTLSTAVQATLTLTTQGMLECHGTFVPSSSSTFGIQAAQNAHTAGTLTIDRGSSLTVRDVNPL